MTPCAALDDYLAGALTGDAAARFVAHLPGCADCRRAVAEQERLAALLTAAVAALEPVPAGLTDRVRRRLRAAHRRRVTAAVMAVAAAVAVAVALLGRTPPRPEPSPPLVKAPAPPAPGPPRPAEHVRVRFPGGNVLAVPEKMDSPNVTFVWVYPTLRRQPPAAERSDQ
ncbi:MAG TPA: zf-HC2 domain-containing protein [Gemmataceae bacterium]